MAVCVLGVGVGVGVSGGASCITFARMLVSGS